MSASASLQSPGQTLSNAPSFNVNSGVYIVDETSVQSSIIYINVGPGIVGNTAFVGILCGNKRIALVNKTGYSVQFYLTSTTADIKSPLNYSTTTVGSASVDNIIITTSDSQCNGISIDLRASLTDSGVVNMAIRINISPQVPQYFCPNMIVGGSGDNDGNNAVNTPPTTTTSTNIINQSGFVNITSIYLNRPIVIDNRNLSSITTVSLDKSVVHNNPTTLNLTIKSGEQPVIMNNNTTYPINYSITVLDAGISSLYEGVAQAGQYVPGMTQDRAIEGEYINISITPIFQTQINPTSPLIILGVLITGNVVVLDSITTTNTIPPYISVSPAYNYHVNYDAQYSSSVIKGSQGTLLLNVSDNSTYIPFSINLTSSLSSVSVLNNGSSNLSVYVFNGNDSILAQTYNNNSGLGSSAYYNTLYNAITTSGNSPRTVTTGSNATLISTTIPTGTYISGLYYPSSNGTILAVFTSSNSNDATYINDNVQAIQGLITVAENTVYLNNFTNTNTLVLDSPPNYTIVVDPVNVVNASSQNLPVNGFSGVIGVSNAKSITLTNSAGIGMILYYNTVSGTTSNPSVTTYPYTWISPGSSMLLNIAGLNPVTGTTNYISFSIINAKSSFLVMYATIATSNVFDPQNIVAYDSSIDGDNADISTTIITPNVLTSPTVSIINQTLTSTTNPMLLYINGLNSIIDIQNECSQPINIVYNNGGTIPLTIGGEYILPILYGIASVTVSGTNININPLSSSIFNYTLFIDASTGLFTPTPQQFGGYLNIQFNTSTTGTLVIPYGLANYTPVYIVSPGQNNLSLQNGTGSPLSISFAIYTISNTPTSTMNSIMGNISNGQSLAMGRVSELAFYYNAGTLTGIAIV